MPVPFQLELLDVGGEEEALPLVVAVLGPTIPSIELLGRNLAILRELREPVFAHAEFLRGVFQRHEAHADFDGAHFAFSAFLAVRLSTVSQKLTS